MKEGWNVKTDEDFIDDKDRDREKERDTPVGVATLRSSRHCGVNTAPLRNPSLSMGVRIGEWSPQSSPCKTKRTSARLPSTPHPKSVYPSSDSDSIVDVSYGHSDWDDEAFKGEEEVDTDDDVAQIERARRIRDGGIESEAEVVRKTMRKMDIGSGDSEEDAQREGQESIPRAKERARALLADIDTGLYLYMLSGYYNINLAIRLYLISCSYYGVHP